MSNQQLNLNPTLTLVLLGGHLEAIASKLKPKIRSSVTYCLYYEAPLILRLRIRDHANLYKLNKTWFKFSLRTKDLAFGFG